jgi:hypothetical protein
VTIAAAALSLTALAALPASATEITVSLQGKTAAQIKADLRAAAEVVRKTDYSTTLMGGYASCISAVYDDALAQAAAVAMPAL